MPVGATEAEGASPTVETIVLPLDARGRTVPSTERPRGRSPDAPSQTGAEAAMLAYRSGLDICFMTKESSAVLRPVAFGGHRSRDNEIRLHSHLGECFAGDWAINKNRHMLFGQRFVWVTDCYAACFILSYDGNNPAVLRLQMHLMCWDIDVVHRNNIHLTDANYWSRLGADIYFDPLFKSYLNFDRVCVNASPLLHHSQ
jgi:hypothetical protein